MIAGVLPGRQRLQGWLPWSAAVLLAGWCYLIAVVAARVGLLGRFDDGIEYTTVTYLLHGQIPYTDFYEPYGIGLGIPGVLPHLLGFDGVFVLRLVYGLFAPLVTLLVTPLVWRRCGAVGGILVGLITITSASPRYSMGFAALFGFALLIDSAVRRTDSGTLQELAGRRPMLLVGASMICSLAGWARTEYAVFAVVWAVILVMVLPKGRTRWLLAFATLVMAAGPSLIVLVTGGLRHLWWFISYTLSSSPSGFHAQRGEPIEWHLIGERFTEILHLQLGPSEAATIVGSYGLAALVVLAAVVMLLVPAGREWLLRRDKSYLTPFMVIVCAVVMYGQLARFSPGYGQIANPVFWVAAAMLAGRVSTGTVIAVVALVAFPFAQSIAPGTIYDSWAARPAVNEHVAVPGLNRIPLGDSIGSASMAALISEWRKLGLQGRSTLSVELRNDVAWGNEAIVGYLLNAPAAAWPLTYDPGLVNTATVERGTISELCDDRAPVVQADDDFPYPVGKEAYVGSRLLDEFLAVDYRVRTVAGLYRILLPSTARCEMPDQLSDRALAALSEQYLAEGEIAEAGALAIAQIERAEARHEPVSESDASLAALGGYALASRQIPAGALGGVIRVLMGSSGHELAQAAAARWPTDVQRLAAQTAWVAHRSSTESHYQQAVEAVFVLARRHADWPQAVENLSAVWPPDGTLFTQLAHDGARGLPALDRWRRDYFLGAGDSRAALAAGVALVGDYVRRSDPVAAGEAELELADYPAVTPGCSLALRRDASRRPGIRVFVAPGGPACAQSEVLGLLSRSWPRLGAGRARPETHRFPFSL